MLSRTHENAFRATAIVLGLILANPSWTHAATYTPNVFVDLPENPSDSYLTLREAVKQANATAGKDVIQLSAGHFELTAGTAPASKAQYWSGGGALKITQDLDIVGASTTVRMMVGAYGKGDRFMEINPGVNVVVDGVGVGVGGWGGQADIGGAILNNGNLTLRNCHFTHNKALYDGGAIFNRGRLDAKGTRFDYNACGRNGGAIFNDWWFASATLNDCNVSINFAGGYEHQGGHGGGIFNAFFANTTIRNTTVTSNHAYTNARREGGYGGGVFNQGIAPWGRVTVVNDATTKNNAHRFSGYLINAFEENYAGNSVSFVYEMQWNGGYDFFTWP